MSFKPEILVSLGGGCYCDFTGRARPGDKDPPPGLLFITLLDGNTTGCLAQFKWFYVVGVLLYRFAMSIDASWIRFEELSLKGDITAWFYLAFLEVVNATALKWLCVDF